MRSSRQGRPRCNCKPGIALLSICQEDPCRQVIGIRLPHHTTPVNSSRLHKMCIRTDIAANRYLSSLLLFFNTTNMFKPTPQQFSSHQLPPDIARSLSAALNPQDDLNKLKADIHGLIQGFQSEFARNPYDSQVQTKLKALLDLQAVVQSQQLNSDAIGMIKKQVAQLQAVQSQPNPPPSAAPQQSQWQAPTPVSLPFQPPPPIPQGFAPTPSAQPPVAPPAFAPGILEQLLASTANGQKPSTPVVQAALRAMPPPPTNQSPRTAAALPAGPTGNPLLDALRAANILPASASATPVPASGPPVPPPNAAPPALSILQQLQGLAPKLSSTPMPPPGTPAKVRIPMNAAALKRYVDSYTVTSKYLTNFPSSFRPEVVHTLYDAQPNQCTTCGRRFLSTDEGRAQKARHLDWHFRSNQRIADAALAAGLTRSWYIDEMEWLTRLPLLPLSQSLSVCARNTSPHPLALRQTLLVQSVRRSSSLNGMKTHRSGSGWMPSRLAVGCSMLRVTMRSRELAVAIEVEALLRMVLVCLESERLRPIWLISRPS
jgi:hypothetical protein